MDLKKTYYYIICLAALFVLLWGVIDFAGAGVGLLFNHPVSTVADSAGSFDKDSAPSLETYYQKKILYDRLSDSLARILVSGLLFGYARLKVEKIEKG
ncbi:MAG: hypothetical protein ABIH50_05900 [bacterium]